MTLLIQLFEVFNLQSTPFFVFLFMVDYKNLLKLKKKENNNKLNYSLFGNFQVQYV